MRKLPAPSSVIGQLMAVLVAGFVTQLFLTFRGDSAAHVIGGGALAMFLGALTPASRLRGHPAAAELLIFAIVLAAAWVGEMTLFGPFDLDDVAFTIGGAFVALAFVPRWAGASRDERVRLMSAALLLGAAALGHRYLLRIGKP